MVFLAKHLWLLLSQIQYDANGTLFVEQVVNEIDKNHDENDTELNNDARMYQRKDEHKKGCISSVRLFLRKNFCIFFQVSLCSVVRDLLDVVK